MTKASNKFNFLRDRKGEAHEPQSEVEDLPPAPPDPTATALRADAQRQAIAPAPQAATIQTQPEPPKKMGRPRGKRSDPDYEQVTAYIRRDTHTAIKIALLQENQGREFSELVENLLAEYLSTQKPKNSKV